LGGGVLFIELHHQNYPVPERVFQLQVGSAVEKGPLQNPHTKRYPAIRGVDRTDTTDTEHRMDRNYFFHCSGDAIHAVFAAAGNKLLPTAH
jgi:hypothetical protein